MRTICMICKTQFIPDDEDAKRIVSTVDKHNLGTTAIIDMLAPLAGICDEENEDYHVLEFDQEEVDELHKLGEIHKRATENQNRIKESSKTTADEIKKQRKKLKDLLLESEGQYEALEACDQQIENTLNMCECITYSRRIDRWQVEEQPTESIKQETK